MEKTFDPLPYSSNIHPAFVFDNIRIRFENMKADVGRVLSDPFPPLAIGDNYQNFRPPKTIAHSTDKSNQACILYY
jgi:hypothetical protein